MSTVATWLDVVAASWSAGPVADRAVRRLKYIEQLALRRFAER
jgi:hypothetical protein